MVVVGMCETKHTVINAKTSLGIHCTMIPPERTFAVANCFMLYVSIPHVEDLGTMTNGDTSTAP